MIIQPYQIKAQIGAVYYKSPSDKTGTIYDMTCSCSSEYFDFTISKSNIFSSTDDSSTYGVLPLVNDKRLVYLYLKDRYREYCPDFKIISIDPVEYLMTRCNETEPAVFNLTMEIIFYVDYSDLVLIKLSQE